MKFEFGEQFFPGEQLIQPKAKNIKTRFYGPLSSQGPPASVGVTFLGMHEL